MEPKDLMPRILVPEERLIVAADFKPISPNGRDWVRTQVLRFADSISNTGVCIKVNSALRACGYDLIDEIHARGLRVFVDLKLFDISQTLSTDGVLLRETKPELLTVACTTGIEAMRLLKAELPDTEVLGVTVLTSLTDDDTRTMFTCSISEAVLRFAKLAVTAEIDGLISSATEVGMIRDEFGIFMSLNTPAIRPTWAIVPGDDQNPERIMTPTKAIMAGADRIIIGRPITGAKDPREAVMMTLDEIYASMI